MDWTPHAEKVVRRLMEALPHNCVSLIGHGNERLMAFFMGGSMWADYYLLPEGRVVVIGEDYDRPNEVTVHPGWIPALRVLVWGARRYPQLRELIPVRTPDSTDCFCAQHPEIFGPGKVVCSECGGVGWVDGTRSTVTGGEIHP